MTAHFKINSRGSVAILALWVVVLLAFLAVSLGGNMRQKITVFERLQLRQEISEAAESTVKKLIADIQSSDASTNDTATGNEWYHGHVGKTQSFGVGRASAEFVIQDENDKINLNKASPVQLASLFRLAAHLEAEKADFLANAVVDFRDADDFVTADLNGGGSEGGSYRQAGLGHVPKNRDFEFIEELLLVKGMSKDIYNFVQNYITIYGSGRVNINTCDGEALLALDLPAKLADKIIGTRHGPDQKEGTVDDFVFKNTPQIAQDVAQFYELSEDEKESLRRSAVRNEFCVSSEFFKISGRVRIHEPRAEGRFVCVYGAKDGIKYWAQT